MVKEKKFTALKSSDSVITGGEDVGGLLACSS